MIAAIIYVSSRKIIVSALLCNPLLSINICLFIYLSTFLRPNAEQLPAEHLQWHTSGILSHAPTIWHVANSRPSNLETGILALAYACYLQVYLVVLAGDDLSSFYSHESLAAEQIATWEWRTQSTVRSEYKIIN